MVQKERESEKQRDIWDQGFRDREKESDLGLQYQRKRLWVRVLYIGREIWGQEFIYKYRERQRQRFVDKDLDSYIYKQRDWGWWFRMRERQREILGDRGLERKIEGQGFKERQIYIFWGLQVTYLGRERQRGRDQWLGI